MSRPARAVIDRAALRHNLQRVRECAPRSRVLAVVKADGYGHGLPLVAQTLADAGVDGFGVASIDEALILREAGIGARILLLEGFFEPAELAMIQRHRLDIVVHHPEQLARLEALRSADLPLPQPLAVWLKIDSGMHRLGIAPEAAGAAWQRLRDCPVVDAGVRLMSHLASADEPDNPATPEQLRCFAAATAGLAGERSIANSAAILHWPDGHHDWVRPGIMLYGASPFADRIGTADGLRPVMSVGSALLAVNRFRAGDAIGYGGSWVCPQDMPVGVVAFGYGDGYPRHAPPGTPVLVGGQRVPLIGRVSMDMITVDLRERPQAQIGEPVELWGPNLPVEEVARCAGTIAYELLCGVTRRVKFEYRD